MSDIELGRGAEAIVTRTADGILKDRPAKSYRHPVIDATLRKQRTRKEAKLLVDLETLGVPAPKLLFVDENAGIIRMSEVVGEKLRDVLKYDVSLCEQVGKHLAVLHDNDIVHGDVTTSNLMVTKDNTVVFIDFGLSFHSSRIEDRAVDLHLFKQALESKHHLIAAISWKAFLKGYVPSNRDEVLDRLVVVEKRGRNKQ